MNRKRITALVLTVIFALALVSMAFAAASEDSIELIYQGTPKVAYKAIGRASADKHNFVGIERSSEAVDNDLKRQAFKRQGDAVMDIKDNGFAITGIIIKYDMVESK